MDNLWSRRVISVSNLSKLTSANLVAYHEIIYQKGQKTLDRERGKQGMRNIRENTQVGRGAGVIFPLQPVEDTGE